MSTTLLRILSSLTFVNAIVAAAIVPVSAFQDDKTDTSAPAERSPSSESNAESQTEHTHPRISVTKWSGDINVPDPVALSVDNQGRVFVTQTQRRKIQDLDIRQHREWIPDDVGFQTVEDKRAFYKKKLAIDGDQDVQRKWVADVNEDGQHDWRDLTEISERIYRLEDTNGDGFADSITTFYEDFKTEVTGIAAGVVAHQGQVFATVAPDLWKLTDDDQDGVADTKTSIAHGFGLHIAYAGHDMHGPVIGHDGKIYWSIGDKGISVKTPSRDWKFPNQGGVMRCNLDGSDFEVFAHGLRNVQEFDWDAYGNMFGVDNDADFPNERERFVHIVYAMDAGWRCNYQYRGDDYNPWMAEGLWDLPGENHAAYIVPPIQHFIDGPAGFKFNPGTALSTSYRDHFFVTEAPSGRQYAFKVVPDGDSFRMTDDHQIASGTAIVGLAFGPDGALYGADWDGGYPLDQKGSVVALDVPAEARNPSRSMVENLLLKGTSELDEVDLIERLGHEDRRVRLAAQFELVDRNAAYALGRTARDETLAIVHRLHGMWGAGQLARAGDHYCRDVIGLLLKDDEPVIRAQAAATFAELPVLDGRALLQLVDDKDLHVRVQAGLGLARLPFSPAVPELLKAAKTIKPDQHYLRHSIVSALAACATTAQLTGQAEEEDEMVRLCCCLALRQKTSPEIAKFLSDESLWVATAAARGIHDDFSIGDALPALAKTIEDRKYWNTAFLVRAINANYRIGDAAAAQRLATFASESSPEHSVLALQALAEWMSPALLDRVNGRLRNGVADRSLDTDLLESTLTKLVGSDSPNVVAEALRTTAALNLSVPDESLRDIFLAEEVPTVVRVTAFETAMTPTQSDFESFLGASIAELQIAAARRLATLPNEETDEIVTRFLGKLDSGELSSQAAQILVDILATSQSELADETLATLATEFVEADRHAAIGIELLDALKANTKHEDLRNRLLSKGSDSGLPEDLWTFGLALNGGEAAVGKKIFQTNVQTACARCHRVGKNGSNIGPDLTRIAAQRDAKYLLRALVQPSADIEDKYKRTSVLLDTDEVLTGVIVKEDSQKLILANEAGEESEVPVEAIIDRKLQEKSLMPELTQILSPREVRDLLAYLLSLKLIAANLLFLV
ncbi:MAG TPA: hypothetical protein DDW52_12530 [Planctomycetaceae bacterium]|nr:hypothetical protein [Planctomycetaceae bacterium]